MLYVYMYVAMYPIIKEYNDIFVYKLSFLINTVCYCSDLQILQNGSLSITYVRTYKCMIKISKR